MLEYLTSPLKEITEEERGGGGGGGGGGRNS